MAALKVGDGTDPSVDVGPLVNADTRDKVAEFVEDALAKGAKLELGGTVPNGKGFFYPPTVISNVPETADCVHDEIFGPSPRSRPSPTRRTSSAAPMTRNTAWSPMSSRKHEARHAGLRALDYGMVGLNRGLVSDPAAPFGGTKQSGLGREGGHEGMLEFMETQYISAEW
jgi:succinate-semialdehyde dehydrogenase/glutarate-semialdehyde dehydrogenase